MASRNSIVFHHEDPASEQAVLAAHRGKIEKWSFLQAGGILTWSLHRVRKEFQGILLRIVAFAIPVVD
jgi:hypothetical protein